MQLKECSNQCEYERKEIIKFYHYKFYQKLFGFREIGLFLVYFGFNLE